MSFSPLLLVVTLSCLLLQAGAAKIPLKNVLHRSASESIYYSYELGSETGPENWANVYPPGQTSSYSAACAGKQQSPINIVTTDAKTVYTIPAISTNSTSSLEVEDAENLYQKIEVSLVGNHPYVTGGPLFSTKYYLKQWHYHIPSEHTIDGKQYNAKVHYVHVSLSGHIAVFGWFLNRGTMNNTVIQALLDVASDIPEDGDSAKVEVALQLSHLESYYYYPGSLTAPPCYETVDWFVFPTPLSISSAQFNAFYDLFFENNFDTVNITNRPVQDLNGRVVTYVDTTFTSGGTHLVGFGLVGLVLMLIALFTF
jgi:carbonic anhydrase